MSKTLKKTNTLFHSLSEYNYLEKIIRDKGFKASYADEIISGRNVKILMISFSNVALFESETQINYGRYSIGLNLNWGKKNGLNPVIYTYDNSVMGLAFFENYFVAEKDQTILTILDEKEKEMDPAKFGLILDLRQIANNSHKMLLHLKPDIVKNKKGEEFKAYNDREWRYVYEQEGYDSIIFERNFLNGAWIKKYEEAKSYSKPYTSMPVLFFELEDIRYLIVETVDEKSKIIEVLSETFGKEKVIKNIFNGAIDVLSRNALWDNI